MKLSLKEINSIWRYDNGRLYWKINPGNSVRAGDEAGSLNSQHYWQLRYKRIGYNRHRIVYFMHTGELPNKIDHKDQDKTNDRFENLRPASDVLNAQNCNKSWGKTPYRGVYFRKDRNKYHTTIRIAGKQHYLGLFNTAEEASNVYQKYKQIHTAHLV